MHVAVCQATKEILAKLRATSATQIHAETDSASTVWIRLDVFVRFFSLDHFVRFTFMLVRRRLAGRMEFARKPLIIILLFASVWQDIQELFALRK